ncbi:MAG: hypothetical protein JWP71_3182 [Mucilaginibacter sp.]|nr:hypothetical protein [Mucilaginibacter sp.]
MYLGGSDGAKIGFVLSFYKQGAPPEPIFAETKWAFDSKEVTCL